MPKKLSKKKTLRGGWGEKNTYLPMNTIKQKVEIPLKKKKSQKKRKKKTSTKKQKGGSWRSKSIFF